MLLAIVAVGLLEVVFQVVVVAVWGVVAAVKVLLVAEETGLCK